MSTVSATSAMDATTVELRAMRWWDIEPALVLETALFPDAWTAPMFWSDQYGIKIQGAGRPKADDTIHVCHGSPETGSFTALYGRGGRLAGVVTFQQPAKLFAYRKMIVDRVTFEAAIAAAEQS